MSHHTLRTARDHALDAQAHNHHQRHRLANATPERDSLFEELCWLRNRYAITDQDIAPAFRWLREILESNDHELHGERQITGLLDDLASTAHRQARPGPEQAILSVKGLAAMLRPHLQVLASPAGHTSGEIAQARNRVAALTRSVSDERLRSISLAHELRGRCHTALIAYLDRATS